MRKTDPVPVIMVTIVFGVPVLGLAIGMYYAVAACAPFYGLAKLVILLLTESAACFAAGYVIGSRGRIP